MDDFSDALPFCLFSQLGRFLYGLLRCLRQVLLQYCVNRLALNDDKYFGYYSLDGKTWQMVRLYKNEYGDKAYLGICSQAPQSDECISTFKDLQLTTDNVKNFRLGE